MKKIYAIMGASIAVFACLLMVNAYSELANANAFSATGITVLPPADVAKLDNIDVKGASGKFVYKDALSNNAQEQVSVKGEFATPVTSFNQVSAFSFSSVIAGKADAVSDSFAIKPSGVSSDGTKLKMKLFFWDGKGTRDVKSGGGFQPYTTLLGKLKDGKMSFTYIVGIKKPYNDGQLQELEDYNRIRNNMQTMKSYKTSTVVNTTVGLTTAKGTQFYYDTSRGAVNANKTTGSAKLIKPKL